MTKKKKRAAKKSGKKKSNKKNIREKAYGDPMPVKPVLSYVNEEIYPRIHLRPESLWSKIKRFLGLML